MRKHIGEAIIEASNQIHAASKLKLGEIGGLATGFPDLDYFTSGLQPGSLTVVAGRPQMGERCFALNVAQHVALEQSKSVAIFSLELSGAQLAKCMIGATGKINIHALLRGKLEDDDWSRMAEASSRLGEAPLYIDDTAGLSVQELTGRAREMHQNTKLDLIIVDCLQFLKNGSDDESVSQSKSRVEAAEMLKALAEELHVPILLTSQVSRAVENRSNHRPLIADLSDDIERNADVIMFIYRDEIYNSASSDAGSADVIIRKNKYGQTGSMRLKFVEEISSFANLQSDASNHGKNIRSYGGQADVGLRFDNFVIGKANQLAADAARNFVELQMDKLDPLVIYGECGTGTTHLASAIANLMKELKPQSKIACCNAIRFLSDVVYAFKAKSCDQFKQYYRSLDLLILDDFQLLVDKPGTQQELLYTIDALLAAHKRVVITSSILPKNMANIGMNEKLVSRISGGLLVTLGRPELELRIAILKQKAILEGCALDDDAVLYIANNLNSNIRELEGALKRVVAYSRFHNCPFSLDTARKALQDIFFEAKNQNNVMKEEL